MGATPRVADRGLSAPALFRPLTLRGVTLGNRIVVSPMCQYSARAGMANDFHLVHLGKFALGGAGLVFTEQTAVTPDGRVTHADVALWEDAQIAPHRRIAAFVESQGAVPGLQLGHAGRKGSRGMPWNGYQPLSPGDADGEPWLTAGPTEEPAGPGWPAPRAMSTAEVADTAAAFGHAARRAREAGYRVLEVHAAHGYLVHSFLSPISNQRNDRYGGERAGRMRFALEIAEAIRAEWPQDHPLFFRISTIDQPGVGWQVQDSVALAHALHERGVDLIDCSSGGVAVSAADSTRPPSFESQVPHAAAVRQGAGVPTMAVGLIRDPVEANAIVERGDADLVAIAREFLHNPHWPVHAALALGCDPDYALWPRQYGGWLARRARRLAGTDRMNG